MAKYFKLIGEQKVVHEFDIPEKILTDRGWVRYIEPDIDEGVEIINVEEPTEETPQVEKPKRKYTRKTTNQ